VTEHISFAGRSSGLRRSFFGGFADRSFRFGDRSSAATLIVLLRRRCPFFGAFADRSLRCQFRENSRRQFLRERTRVSFERTDTRQSRRADTRQSRENGPASVHFSSVSSSRRSCCLARCSWVLTVPSGRCSASARSSYCTPAR